MFGREVESFARMSPMRPGDQVSGSHMPPHRPVGSEGDRGEQSLSRARFMNLKLSTWCIISGMGESHDIVERAFDV